MKKIKITAVLFLFNCLFISAQAQTDKIYNFLNLGVDARSSAMANSFVSMHNDVNGLFYNPAAMTTMNRTKASVGFFKYLLDINSGNAAYTTKYKDIGFVGAGLRYLDYGSFKKFDEQSNDLGTFGASDLAFSVGFAKNFNPDLSWGVNVKFIYSSIDEYSSTAIATDLGLLYYLPSNKFSAGLSLLNLGTQLSKYSNTSESLPINLTVGVSKQLDYLPLTVHLSLSNLTDKTDNFGDKFKNFKVGGEFLLNDYVDLRLGYNNQQRQDLKTGSAVGLAGFSTGVGIKINNYRLDYAFNSLGNVGSTHRVNLAFDIK
ncbi:MAG TPA: type IX secretion system protein PorQ [Ignavibacteria bacterium]|nr:type IX secretion system protein PorQ [Ignavibacteria bacterium]